MGRCVLRAGLRRGGGERLHSPECGSRDAQAPLYVVRTMILWMVWQYRFAAAMPKGALRRSPGWHAGISFVPVLCLYYPLQNVADLRRAVESGRTQPPDATAGPIKARLPKLYGTWWGLYIAGQMLPALSTGSSPIPGQIRRLSRK